MIQAEKKLAFLCCLASQLIDYSEHDITMEMYRVTKMINTAAFTWNSLKFNLEEEFPSSVILLVFSSSVILLIFSSSGGILIPLLFLGEISFASVHSLWTKNILVSIKEMFQWEKWNWDQRLINFDNRPIFKIHMWLLFFLFLLSLLLLDILSIVRLD